MSASRQLSAIMFSDIEGYTAMMQANEVEGRNKAKHYRSVLKDQVNSHGGRVVQNYGDGSLTTFGSAVEAVRCAQSIQDILSKDPTVPLRIGIHIGDIIVDEGELYGDGINIASRIESMGVAGSVLLSGTVYNEIKNQPDFVLQSLGQFDFKNVSEPVEVFALANENLIVPKASRLKGGKFKERSSQKRLIFYMALVAFLMIIGWGIWQNLNPPDRTTKRIQSIAVLPLKDLTNQEEQSYLIEGLHAGLIGSLGNLGDLKIISKFTASKYLDSLDIQLNSIAGNLGVDGILRGEFYNNNDSLEIHLELIKPIPNEELIWSNQYMVGVSEMPNVQRDVTMQIAQAVDINIAPDKLLQLTNKSDVDAEIYKAYLRGIHFLNKSTPDDFRKGMSYLQEAVSLDPANPLVYTGLAWGYVVLAHGPNPDETMWKRAKAAAIQAIKLDSTIAEAHAILAIVTSHFEWKYEEAAKAFEKALAINPNDAMTHFQYAWFLTAFDRWEEAIYHHKLAKELDPLNPAITSDMGSLYYWTDSLELALKEAQEGLQLNAEFGHGWWVLGNIYNGMKEYDQAIEAHIKAASIDPIWKGALASTYAFSGDAKSARDLIAEIKGEQMSARTTFWLAHAYMALDELDSTFYWLNYQPQDWWIGFIRTWPEFKLLYDDNRFHQLIADQGLPPIEE